MPALQHSGSVRLILNDAAKKKQTVSKTQARIKNTDKEVKALVAKKKKK